MMKYPFTRISWTGSHNRRWAGCGSPTWAEHITLFEVCIRSVSHDTVWPTAHTGFFTVHNFRKDNSLTGEEAGFPTKGRHQSTVAFATDNYGLMHGSITWHRRLHPLSTTAKQCYFSVFTSRSRQQKRQRQLQVRTRPSCIIYSSECTDVILFTDVANQDAVLHDVALSHTSVQQQCHRREITFLENQLQYVQK